MSAPTDLSERLRRLEQILDGSRGPASGDAAELVLASVLIERIGKTTAELKLEAPIDAARALAMRLLLADYGAAVGQLRAVSRTTERRLTEVADALRTCKRDADRAAAGKLHR